MRRTRFRPPRPLDLLALLTFACLLVASCRETAPEIGGDKTSPVPDYAILIYGGAGSFSVAEADERRDEILAALSRALEAGVEILDGSGTSLDAVEQVIRVMEDDPTFNAGRGAVFNHAGGHELDASIMDGATLACGAVAGVATVRHPISLARRVMTDTRHVLLGGAGAERFADEVGVERVANEFFSTPDRRREWETTREASAADGGGTVGVVALDRRGHLAAGTSTGGLTDKMYGRIGDSPVVGAGTYADDRTCAVSCSGVGEEFIRHNVAHAISAVMEHGGVGLTEAVELVVAKLRPGDGGVIAVDRFGNLVARFNTRGMLRGAADSTGRFEVRVWPGGP